MSKLIKSFIKVSLREIPIWVKVISSIIIIYCMYISVRYGYLGVGSEGYKYPVYSYWYMVYGISYTIYINYIFSIYRDSNTSTRELLMLGKQRVIGENYFYKNFINMLILLIPLILLIIPVYLQLQTMSNPISLVFHGILCVSPAILLMSYALLINTLKANPLMYIMPIIYILIIEPALTVTFNLNISITTYLSNYGLITSINKLYLSTILHLLISMIFILISYYYLNKRRN